MLYQYFLAVNLTPYRTEWFCWSLWCKEHTWAVQWIWIRTESRPFHPLRWAVSDKPCSVGRALSSWWKESPTVVIWWYYNIWDICIEIASEPDCQHLGYEKLRTRVSSRINWFCFGKDDLASFSTGAAHTLIAASQPTNPYKCGTI